MTTAIVPKVYAEHGVNAAFTFREDGWFNMTQAAKVFDKRLDFFFKTEETRQYMRELAVIEYSNTSEKRDLDLDLQNRMAWFCARKRDGAKESTVCGVDMAAFKRLLTDTSRGHGGGTWAHPKLAVFFARWLDTRFGVWCDSIIADILKGAAEVVITKPAESSTLALPQDYLAALESLVESVKKTQMAEAKAHAAEAKAAELTKELDQAAPAVEFVEKFSEEGDNQTFTAVAKVLGVPPRSLTELLYVRRDLYRGKGQVLLASQKRLDQRVFVIKTTSDSRGIPRFQTLVTPKGVLWLSEWVPAHFQK